jgi:hypothetical protein
MSFCRPAVRDQRGHAGSCSRTNSGPSGALDEAAAVGSEGTFPAGLSIRRVVVDDGQMVSVGSSQAPPIVVYQSRITYHSSAFRGIEPEQRNINPRKYSSTSSFSTRFAKPRHGS